MPDRIADSWGERTPYDRYLIATECDMKETARQALVVAR
jgi:hypothetical protein